MIKLGIIFWALQVLQSHRLSFSQELKKAFEWEVKNVVDATSDIAGNIYVSDEQGNLSKFSKDGQNLLSYSGNTISPISSVDVSHTSKVFGFYKDNQAYLILDRFLSLIHEAALNTSLIGYVTETAYAADNKLWIFDQSDLSIKKMDLINDILVTSISVSLIISDADWDIRQIEEYQNRIYIYNSNKEVYILDNFGNFIKKLPIRPDCNFGFNDENMVFIQGAGIFKSHLYSDALQQIGVIKNTNSILKVISTNNFIYLISKNKITAYR